MEDLEDTLCFGDGHAADFHSGVGASSGFGYGWGTSLGHGYSSNGTGGSSPRVRGTDFM
jgi:hypothetical protein